ncbi:MAG: DNA-processing protein DprA [Candidatus Pacebacteria bacterium]|nr:DNA-processing protein DprA [Candidatus Paceibacterota bacterium]
MSNLSKIKIVKEKESLFPESLKKIKNPPKTLYLLGDLDIKNKPILAVVGTRRCTDYGKKVVINFTKNLAEAGFIIVSGLAKGIDTLAHKTCLEYKGKTIAVLGSGLDRIYPKENKVLAEEILKQGGAIISEYPPGTPPNHFHFPERNRIIAGLSLGVLVIEAREKSGALITADWAFLQKKPVFAVPGPIYEETSSGCHLLIQKGAKLVTSPDQILQFFGVSFKKRKTKIEGTDEEKIILNLLLDKTLHIDQIIQKSKVKPQKVLQILSKLELEGKIKNLGGNIFTII